jgi:hypothetical protein
MICYLYDLFIFYLFMYMIFFYSLIMIHGMTCCRGQGVAGFWLVACDCSSKLMMQWQLQQQQQQQQQQQRQAIKLFQLKDRCLFNSQQQPAAAAVQYAESVVVSVDSPKERQTKAANYRLMLLFHRYMLCVSDPFMQSCRQSELQTLACKHSLYGFAACMYAWLYACSCFRLRCSRPRCPAAGHGTRVMMVGGGTSP